MKMTKSSIIFIIVNLVWIASYAQTPPPKIAFDYDPVGNRIQRRFVPPIIKKDVTAPFVGQEFDSLLVTNAEDNSVVTGDKTDDLSENVTTASIGTQSITIYPNPTMDRLTIGLKNFSAINSAKVEITDSRGKKIFSSDKPEPVYSIDLSNYAPGYYYINLNVNGVAGNYSVIKQ